MGEAAARVGRDANSVRLLAAAKAQSVEAIRAAIAGGVALIGENYVQEAQEKKARLSEPAEWHMIGHLQRNKAKLAVQLFDLIESLDSIALARELDKEGRSRGKMVRVFVEVNVAGEESKSGIAKSAVVSLMEAVAGLSHLRIEGLMTVPPFRENLEDVRPYFRELRELKGSAECLGSAQRRAERAVDGHDPRLYRRDRRGGDDCASRHGAIRPAESLADDYLCQSVGRVRADRRLCVVGLCVDFISAGRDFVDQCRLP